MGTARRAGGWRTSAIHDHGKKSFNLATLWFPCGFGIYMISSFIRVASDAIDDYEEPYPIWSVTDGQLKLQIGGRQINPRFSTCLNLLIVAVCLCACCSLFKALHLALQSLAPRASKPCTIAFSCLRLLADPCASTPTQWLTCRVWARAQTPRAFSLS